MYKYTDKSYLKEAFNNKHDIQLNTCIQGLHMYKDDINIQSPMRSCRSLQSLSVSANVSKVVQ